MRRGARLLLIAVVVLGGAPGAGAQDATKSQAEAKSKATAKAKSKAASKWKFSFDMDGFYSVQLSYLNNVADLKGSVLPGASVYREPLHHTMFFAHHLRFEPRVSIGKYVTLRVRLDGLQHVVWGDNDGRASSPLFAGNPTNTNDFGEAIASIKLVWAYMDVNLKLGLLRVGRMPSNWGMGLLANGGGDLALTRGGVDDMWGDNRLPSIVDRIAFATRPISVAKALMGRKDIRSNLVFAYAYDRLVEEPFWKEIDADLQRPYGEQSFLSRQVNNVDEHVFVLLWRDKKFLPEFSRKLGWKPGLLTLGAYVVYRRQGAYRGILRYFDGRSFVPYDCALPNPPPACGAQSNVVVIDPYLKIRLGPFEAEFESYVITGTTEKGRGIPIGDNVGKALIFGWTGRLSYSPLDRIKVVLEMGQASGDELLQDGTFRQRPLHPDHGVGLILYRQFLRERSATSLAQSLNSNVGGTLQPARGLQSNGGVINSVYLYPRAWIGLNDMLTLKFALLTGWADKQDGILFAKDDCDTRSGGQRLGCRAGKRHIGTEIDIGLDVKWAGPLGGEHLLFRFDMGYLVFGKQVSADYDSPGVFALRARLMMVF